MSKYTLTLLLALFLCFGLVGTVVASSDTLVIGSGGEAVGLDPRLDTDVPSFERINVILEPLATISLEMEVVPRLATGWEFSDDSLTITFHLREGVYWHDGEPFTAEDVKYTYEWILDGDNAAPNRGLYTDIVEIEIETDHLVHFHLSNPNVFLLNNIARMNIVPAHVGDDDTFRTAPVGTGPYMFDFWRRDDEMRLKANPNYWGGEPIMPFVSFRAIPENATKLLALEAGDIDTFQGGIVSRELPRLEEDPNIIVERTPGTGYSYLGFNTKVGPLAEKEVRQAISMIINREAIVQRVLNGVGEPGVSPIPPNLPWFTDEVIDLSYNPEKAKAMLEEAGVTDLKLRLYTNENPDRMRIAEIMQFEAQQLGIDIEVNIEEWGAYLNRIQFTEDYDIFILGWGGQLDPDRATIRQFSTDGGSNYTFFSHERLDYLLHKGRTVDPATQESLDIYKEAQQIIVEYAPYGFINYTEEVLLRHPNVQNVSVHPYSANTWQDAHLMSK